MAVAGVIFVGHGHGHGDVYVNDHDHQPTLPLGASVRPGKEALSAAFRDVAALVPGLGTKLGSESGPWRRRRRGDAATTTASWAVVSFLARVLLVLLFG